MISQKKQIILLGWTSRSRWNQREIFIFMVFSSQHKSLAQKIKFVADDLWNDNRRLERLLKTEAGASSVALGKRYSMCMCVLKCVCLSHSFDILCWDSSYNSSHNILFQVCRTDLLQNTNRFLPVQ